jgi:hypothetical protein
VRAAYSDPFASGYKRVDEGRYDFNIAGYLRAFLMSSAVSGERDITPHLQEGLVQVKRRCTRSNTLIVTGAIKSYCLNCSDIIPVHQRHRTKIRSLEPPPHHALEMPR